MDLNLKLLSTCMEEVSRVCLQAAVVSGSASGVGEFGKTMNAIRFGATPHGKCHIAGSLFSMNTNTNTLTWIADRKSGTLSVRLASYEPRPQPY